MSIAGRQFDSLRLSGFEIRRLGWAFAVSLAAHLLFWRGYELGMELNVWQRLHWPAWVPVPKWIQLTSPSPAQSAEPPLVFVDVNPEQAAAEAPKNARYYSDKSSRAANPEADRNANQPKLNGQQTDMVKTENVPRTQFSRLQPTPAAQPANTEQEELRSRQTLEPGDLTLVNPDDLQRRGDSTQERPRTIEQALARQPQNRLPGLQMRQEGGVHRQRLVPSLDAKATPFGAYDRAFIEAVTQRWYDLLDSRRFALDRTGRVMLRFHLNYDGRITDMRVLENTVGEVLGYVCQKAVEDPAPYAPWPGDMRLMVGGDYREITFTFYYY